MARTVTLSQLRTDVAAQCDFSVGASGRYTPTLLNRLLNQSVQRFRERISNEGMTHYLVSTTGTVTSGATSPYAFKTLDLSAASPNIVRVYGVDLTVSGIVKTLAHRPFQERNDYGAPSITGEPMAWAMYQTTSIALMPAPDQSYSYTVWYLPLLADMSADGDTFDGVAGWEQWIVWDVVCQLIARDTYQSAYNQAVQLRTEVWQDIIRSSTKVTSAGGALIGRDTLRAGGFGRRAFSGPIVSGGSGLPPDGSVTNAMLASAPEATIKGRARGAGPGSPTDLVPAQVAAITSVFSGFAAGLVPTGGGDALQYLNQAGAWSTPSVGGSVSGLALSQVQNIAPDRVLGRSTAGTGTVEQLRGQQVASMIGTFTGAAHGLVPMPTGGFGAGAFLRDDATWATPAGGGAGGGTGASPSALFFFPPLTVLGNSSSASGVSEFMGRGQVASLLPLFGTASGATRGLVYSPTAGVAGRFLSDDGVFRGVPSNVSTGITLSQLAAIPATTILGRTSPSGIPQALTPSAVATMMPLFNTVDKGLTPAPGVVSGNFLRDDGTWQTTAGGSATGVSNSMLLPMPPFSLKGRNDLASGIPQDITIAAVASMLPNHFGGSGTTRGFVYAPTGGLANNFLRDDGVWATPAGGAGGGPTMLAAGPQFAVQYNGGSGLAGATGLLFSPSGFGLQLAHNLRIPTGTVLLGATGAAAAPEAWLAGYSGALNIGLGTGTANPAVSIENPSAEGLGSNLRFRSWDVNGLGAPREWLGIERSGPSGANTLYFGHPSDTSVAWLRSARETNLIAAGATGVIRGRLGANATEAFAARPGHHSWGVSGAQKMALNEDGLSTVGRLGVQPLAHSGSTDKLASWTASGFANVATGINVGASGLSLSVGSGGAVLHASGADFRSSSLENVKRINGLDGIKLYGFIPGGGAASGSQNITSPSGTAFIVPETTTTGQVFALVPTLAFHGDTVLVENRSGLSHMINNTGTGMGVPSFFVATLPPSGGLSFRFASGAWEYGNRYKLGGA